MGWGLGWRFFVAWFFCLLANTSSAKAITCSSHVLSGAALGSQLDIPARKIVFRVYSKAATRIDLELFATPKGASKLTRRLTKDSTTNIWEATIHFDDLTRAGWRMTDAAKAGFVFPYYSYRAWGPNWKEGALIGKISMRRAIASTLSNQQSIRTLWKSRTTHAHRPQIPMRPISQVRIAANPQSPLGLKG